jgi:PAS domain S-box-containing protein
MAIKQVRLHADLAYQSGLTRTVAENATSGLLLTDPTGQVTYVNSAGARITGYGFDELAGRRFHDVVHHQRPDGTPYPMEECPIWRTVLGEERVLAPIEDTFIRPDGTFYPVRIAAAPARRDGRVVGVVIEVQDISAEHAVAGRLSDLAVSASDRAAKLRGLIQSIGDAVVVAEPDGSVSLMNPAAIELFGPRLTHVDELYRRLQDHDGARLDRDATDGGSYMVVGSPRETWLEARVFAVPASGSARADTRTDGRADGGDHGRIHVFRDVTASRRAKVMRETFIGMLSHELRTPITTVYGGAKVLARRSEQLLPDVRSIVADIEAESERLYRLVEDLVVLTKSESASLEAGREPILLQRMVPRLVATEARRWPSIAFHAGCPASLPPVMAEQTYVEQVVRNLLTNAAKYGGSAGTVDVDAWADGGEVVVRVGDRGPGFPGEDAERLFDIYYRSPAVARQAAGAGIGLFVCKSLVEAMGGRIWAGDRDGGGAEFSFALPAMADPADMDEDGGRD